MPTIVEKSVPVALLLFGCLILLTSLLAANRTSAGDRTRLMARKVYFNRTILPDNIFYPVLMIGDKIKLETAGFEEQIALKLEYADRRYAYAIQLLDKDQSQLALTTLTKSQKYLFSAGNEVLTYPERVKPETIVAVKDSYAESLKQLPEFRQNYSEHDAQTIDELYHETEIIYKKLSTLGVQPSN